MFEPTTDYEKVCQKLTSVSATLEERFDNSTDDFEANAQLDRWNVNGKRLMVVSSDEGSCGLYVFFGEDGDAIDKDLALIDVLANRQKPKTAAEEIVFNELLSKDDFFRLTATIKRDGAIDENEADRLVTWANKALCEAECVRFLIDGSFEIDGWNGDVPNIVLPKEGIDLVFNFDDSKPQLEESNYAANV